MFSRRHFVKIIKYTPLAVLLYFEIVPYLLLPLSWPDPIECTSPKCVRILLVADPQILGEVDSAWIARWDADRFLRSTFRSALEYSNPDVIIYLGDLMDEGHISSDEQFTRDLERFVDIFSLPSDVTIERIYVPGDNDIGGEGDPILPHIVARFNNMFEPTADTISYLNLEFFKVNKMTQKFQEPEVISNEFTRIALSHVPVLRKIHTISKKIANSVQPHLIFSGHDHDSMYLIAPVDDPWRKTLRRLSEDDVGWQKYQLTDNLMQELVVPTCSYRMGTPHMGYGLAFIDHSTRTLSYTVLWLPQRLLHLIIYMYLGIVCGLVLCCYCLVSGSRYIRQRRRHGNELYRRVV